MGRQKLVAGNWKMHGSRESVDHLLKAIKARVAEVGQTELAVFPPFIFIEKASQLLANSPIAWGAQNVSTESQGPFTGEVCATMLSDYGCQYVIVGHSERRALYGENDEIVAAKFRVALDTGLKPILCVGEPLAVRETGEAIDFIIRQLDTAWSFVDNHSNLSQAVIAYEPIWAIGTGQNAAPEQAQEVHQAIRHYCLAKNNELGQQLRILYGGSVKPDNAAALFSMADIDGALVGGASLDADKFIQIGLLCNN